MFNIRRILIRKYQTSGHILTIKTTEKCCPFSSVRQRAAALPFFLQTRYYYLLTYIISAMLKMKRINGTGQQLNISRRMYACLEQSRVYVSAVKVAARKRPSCWSVKSRHCKMAEACKSDLLTRPLTCSRT